MAKDKLNIILNSLAKVVRKSIPKGKAYSKLAMEYDIAPSEMCDILRGRKNIKIETLFKLFQATNKDMMDFMQNLKDNLPENFTIGEI